MKEPTRNYFLHSYNAATGELHIPWLYVAVLVFAVVCLGTL